MDDRIKAAVAATKAIALPDICTVEDLAPFLHIGVSAVRKLANRRAIPARKIGKRWYFARMAILEWIGSQEPTQPTLRVLPAQKAEG